MRLRLAISQGGDGDGDGRHHQRDSGNIRHPNPDPTLEGLRADLVEARRHYLR